MIVLVPVSAQYDTEVSSEFFAVRVSAQYGSEASVLMSAQHGTTSREYGSEGRPGLFPVPMSAQCGATSCGIFKGGGILWNLRCLKNHRAGSSFAVRFASSTNKEGTLELFHGSF